MKFVSIAALFFASSAEFDAVQIIEGRADSSEMLADLFADSPTMSAYLQGRADGLREAAQVVRWARHNETH